MLPEESEKRELGPFDETNPRAIISLVTPIVGRYLINAKNATDPNGNPAAPLFEMDEDSLLKKMDTEFSIIPSVNEQRLRLNFWLEFEQANMQGRKMVTSRIVSGVCREDHFFKYLKRPALVAYMLCPPANYRKMMETALHYGLSRLHRILLLPLEDPLTGKADHKQISNVLKIVQLLDMRLHGAYTQKIEQTNRNINLDLNQATRDVSNKISVNTVKEIEDRMSSLGGTKKIRDVTNE